MKYKMIVLDLDDTLLRDDHTISERTKNALMEAQKQGVKVVLASGRPTFGMRKVAEELSLEKFGSYILSFNGGKIIDCRTDEELFNSSLTAEEAHRLYEISKREGVSIHTYIGDEIITQDNHHYTKVESEITGLPTKVVGSFTEAVDVPVVKALMVGDPEVIAPLNVKLNEEIGNEYSITPSKPFFLEFMVHGISKGSSLLTLIEKCGITREEVIAMGDSYNDVEMIKMAGLGVAMGNAPDDVKEIADYVTDTNMNDGVAKVVETFVLNELVKQ